MKTLKIVSIFSVITLALVGQSSSPSLTAACQIAGNPSYPDCVDGEITFSGTSFSGTGNSALVYVTNSTGKVLDSADYSLSGGSLTFTENLSIADTYTISVNGTAMLTVTTNGKN